MMVGLEGSWLGTCELVRRIGSGGMGEVYLAQQPALGRQVAVKVIRGTGGVALPPDLQARATQRFTQEARAIAALEHPNILPLYEFGEQDGIRYFVMPHVPEGSLADQIAAGALALPLAPSVVMEIVSQTAAALQYAHDHGVVHRDVKPQNLLLRWLPPQPSGSPAGTRMPQALLADFGLARYLAEISGGSGTTGTPQYTAPEQYSGHPLPASDQYALACVAYLLLTGQPVFAGDVVALHHQHLVVMPAPPISFNPSLPPAVDTVLLRALAKDPAQRYPQVLAFAQALRQALLPADQTAGMTSRSPAWPAGAMLPMRPKSAPAVSPISLGATPNAPTLPYDSPSLDFATPAIPAPATLLQPTTPYGLDGLPASPVSGFQGADAPGAPLPGRSASASADGLPAPLPRRRLDLNLVSSSLDRRVLLAAVAVLLLVALLTLSLTGGLGFLGGKRQAHAVAAIPTATSTATSTPTPRPTPTPAPTATPSEITYNSPLSKPPWTGQVAGDGTGTWTTSSGTIIGTATDGYYTVAIDSGSPHVANVDVTFTITPLGGPNGPRGGVVLRYTSPSSYLNVNYDTNGSWYIETASSGHVVPPRERLFTASVLKFNTAYTVRVRYFGTHLTVWLNGVEKYDGDPTGIKLPTGPGLIGFLTWYYSSNALHRLRASYFPA